MQRTVLFMILLLALSLGDVIPAYPADELFDTKAAAAHTDKGIEYIKKKDLDAAIKEFEESISINPDAEAYYFLGYAYYLKGKTGDGESRKLSKENFEKAYELNPGFTPSRLMEPGPAAPTAAAPQQKAPAQEAEPETEGGRTGVYQGTAQPEQKAPETQTPSTAPEPEKEQQPPPAEPPKEEQPSQPTEQQQAN